jgi:hypothetical protein
MAHSLVLIDPPRQALSEDAGAARQFAEPILLATEKATFTFSPD